MSGPAILSRFALTRLLIDCLERKAVQRLDSLHNNTVNQKGNMKNIEIKAKIHEWDQFMKSVHDAADPDVAPVVMDTVDTFFKVDKGRLKLREFLQISEPRQSELIHYHRHDTAGSKLSEYSKCLVSDSQGLKRVLCDALGILGEVKKTRHLYMSGQTRIHVDRVDSLGDFMELEVVLREDQTEAEGHTIVNELMMHLGVKEQDLIPLAYMDLIILNDQSV